MMGVTHSLSGVAAGLGVAPLVGVNGVAETVLFAVVTAGYALLPDLDHDGASAPRLLGPVTNLLSELVQALSSLLYRLTKGRNDENHDGEHRHLTHTAAFAVGVGLLAAWGGSRTWWAVAGIAVFGVLLAEDRLGDWVLPVVAGAGLLWWVTQPDGGTVPGTLEALSWTVGVAVGLGCVTHDLGDMLTEHGVPLLWPVPIFGETWYEIRPPSLIRFRTGGFGEAVVTVLLVAAIGWLGWRHLAPTLDPTAHTVEGGGP